MPDQSLLVLLDEVRGKTIRLLHSIPAEDARWAPAGLQNTTLWHGGHAYILLECLAMGALGRTPDVPDGWFAMFSWESHPERVAADRWPSLALVIARLEGHYKRMRRPIGKLIDEKQSSRRPAILVKQCAARSSSPCTTKPAAAVRSTCYESCAPAPSDGRNKGGWEIPT